MVVDPHPFDQFVFQIEEFPDRIWLVIWQLLEDYRRQADFPIEKGGSDFVLKQKFVFQESLKAPCDGSANQYGY